MALLDGRIVPSGPRTPSAARTLYGTVFRIHPKTGSSFIPAHKHNDLDLGQDLDETRHTYIHVRITSLYDGTSSALGSEHTTHCRAHTSPGATHGHWRSTGGREALPAPPSPRSDDQSTSNHISHQPFLPHSRYFSVIHSGESDGWDTRTREGGWERPGGGSEDGVNAIS